MSNEETAAEEGLVPRNDSPGSGHPYTMAPWMPAESPNVLEPYFVLRLSDEDQIPDVIDTTSVPNGRPPCSPSVLIEELTKFVREDLPTPFKRLLINYLCQIVPRIFTPVDLPAELLTPKYDNDRIMELIFDPLERVLIGEKSEDFYHAISSTNVPTGSCGRVFKSGEATYSCRDCGADPTCVLCIECFNNSAHKNHRYKFSTSSGGGYCDCGDVEAWKQDALCSVHQTAGSTEGSSLSPQKELLATWLLTNLLHYANDVLSNEYAVSTNSIPIIRDAWGTLDEKVLNYSLIIYNDEIHTFEIVIHVLTRVFHMDKKHAADFTNKIHSEGRAIVRATTFEECCRLRKEVIKCTQRTSGKPLRVDIRQSALVAHQHCGMHLLRWINRILNLSSAYRNVFHSIVSKETPNSRTFLQILLLNDTKSWKQVRELWHHLLIAGLLKEYDLKKKFATVFADCYGEMMTEFGQDDHDHVYSVTALSVQILTVPTLAHYLIEERHLFFNIMRAILSEVEPRVKNGKLQYEQRHPTVHLRRTLYALVDIKYLLTSAPNPWTPDLRKQFMDGFASLVKFCRFLQESDPLVRQLGEHLEYEPEWEAAFNINVKLSPVLTLIYEWCASDQSVCSRAYRRILQELSLLESQSQLGTVVQELADHSATCYVYDISLSPVSIYLPLTRLLASVHLAFHGHGLEVTEFKRSILRRFGPVPEFTMEAPLRTITLVAQRHAGMWKKNGFSLLNQLYFYQNVRCRTDMYDKDILSLQIAASEIESNEFLIHVMNRFNILHWMEEDYGMFPPVMEEERDNLMYTQLLVEEFLLLVITLVSGRFLPGVGVVTREDCIRKQIIQSLCIGCMTHSELNRYLEENVNGETGIEAVVRDVANIKKMKNGDVYELKPEFYSDYDVFYYHYVREEMSKAEEAQRARKLALKEADLFPPPRLPPFSPNFTMLINLLKADVLLSVFQTTIKRCMLEECNSYTDAQLRKALHLIGYGLNEELEQNEVDPFHFFQFTNALSRWKIVELLKSALDSGRVAPHKETILWVIATYGILRPSKPASMSTEQVDVQQDEELRIRKERAAAAKARSMASISSLQNKFRTVNADLLGDDDESSGEDFIENDRVIEAVCLGMNRTPQLSATEELHCILCKEKQDLTGTCTTAFVASCFVQCSKVLDQGRGSLSNKGNLQMEPTLRMGFFIGACGHVMHKTCWKKHFDNIVQKERRRPYRQLQLFDTERNECLCPMCTCLQNAVLPVLPPVFLFTSEVSTFHAESEPSVAEFETWLDLLFFNRKYSRETAGKIPTIADLTAGGTGFVKLYEKLWPPIVARIHRAAKALWQQHNSYDEFLSTMANQALAFADSIPAKAAMYASSPEVKHMESIRALWCAVAFTITSMEMSNREQGVAFFGKDVPSSTQLTLKYLTRLGGSVLNAPTKGVPFYPSQCAIQCTELLWEHAAVPLRRVDAFALLVSAAYSFPFLFTDTKTILTATTPQTGNAINIYIFQLLFFLHMIQILSQADMHELISHNRGRWAVEVDNPQAPETPLSKFCRKIWSVDSTIPICWDEILEYLEERVVPFVTCCCKFFECYTGIDAVNFLPQGTTLHVMLKYLAQPTDLQAFFESEKLVNLGLQWVGESGLKTETIFPRKILDFYPIPNDYLDLINSVAGFACPTNEAHRQESRHPTLCLLCGQVLCSQCSSCVTEVDGASVGQCTQHALECGAGTSIFLRIRDSKCFLLSSHGRKGAYVPPPYVDEYGETDQGLRRGNPLRLSQEKLQFLRKLCINHSIQAEIVRVNERNASSPALMYTDWARL